MYTLTYPTPATGGTATETYRTEAEALAAADDARRALIACGYGAHLDGVRVAAQGIPSLPVGTTLYYVGPRPPRDVPSWMKSPVSLRRVDTFGDVEVFTADGSRNVDAAHLSLSPADSILIGLTSIDDE